MSLNKIAKIIPISASIKAELSSSRHELYILRDTLSGLGYLFDEYLKNRNSEYPNRMIQKIFEAIEVTR